jgi:hypothetical protein
MKFDFRSCSARPRISVVVLLVASLLAILVATAAGAVSPRSVGSARRHASPVHASAARLLPPRLHAAASRINAADRAFVATAKALRRCHLEHRTRAKLCNSVRRALQRTGRRLRHAQGELSSIAVKSSRAGTGADTRNGAGTGFAEAPGLSVSEDTLDWTRVDSVDTYVLVRKVPGQADQYSLVRGTSLTPPPVPGVTVGYSVRTSALGSAWSTEVSIAYPPVPVESEAPDPQSAPSLTVSGDTLMWDAVADVQDYVLATDVPGQATQYSVVSGTSVTPPAIPGSTVSYSVRTAVEGSVWSPTAAIAYPANDPVPPPAEEPASAPSELQTGLNSGTEPVDFTATTILGAKLVRLPFSIEDTPAQLKYSIEKYAAEGVTVLPLACFSGRIPTPAEAQNLASWAAAYGPGGSFWAGRSDGNLAIKSIEFGNETSYSYQFSKAEDSPSGYAARAQSYAVRFAEAAKTIRSTNPGVGLLAQGDAGNAGSIWIENMFKAVPNLGQLVAGWTIHPYGPTWRPRVEALIKETAEQGAPSTIPIDITEFGVSTDNGQCLTENYGWPLCMTYQEAGEALTGTLTELRQVLGGRPGMFLLYTDKDWHSPGATNEREAYFGALQYSLAPKGAYTTAVEAMLASS